MLSTPPALLRLLTLAAKWQPALKGEAGKHHSGCITLGEDNSIAMQALYRHWQTQCPEAGPAYWAVRSWTLMTWQPVYLSLLGVQELGTLPNLETLSQKQSNGVVAGFYLADVQCRQDTEAELIAQAGAALRACCEALLTEFSAIARLRPVLARRLVADTLLDLLSELGRATPSRTQPQTQSLARHWLEAMALPGASALMPVTLADGQKQLALQRKACCLHYLRSDGTCCPSCPKLSLAERRKRISQALSARLCKN